MRQVFISYRQEGKAHSDTVRALAEKLLAQGLPVGLDQFEVEQHPAGPDEGWPKWCEDRASNAEAVLVIASPGWFAAYSQTGPAGTGLGAGMEARVFRQDFYENMGINPRVRFVELETSGDHEYPRGLGGWHRFRPTARPEDFAQLVAWLRQRLAIVAVDEKKERMVYLAETYLDDDPLRAGLAQELTDAGWKVLPAGEYADETYEADVTTDLKRAIAFIQLLLPQRWKGSRRDILQHKLATQVGVKCLRFRDPDVDIAKVTDEEQRNFLTADPNIRATQFDQFKKEVLQALRETWDKLQQPPPPPAVPGQGRRREVRVVMHSAQADQHWKTVFRWLKEFKDIFWEKVPADEAGAKLLTARQAKRACHGFLFVCDEAALKDPAFSPHEHLEECYSIQADAKDDSKCPPVGVLYWPGPPSEEAFPAIFSYYPPITVEMPVLDEQANPPVIGSFLDAVRKVEL